MKRILILLMVAITAAVPMFSQQRARHSARERAEMRKEILDFKLKYLAQEIDLQDDQRERFCDLYSKMEEERSKLFEEANTVRMKVKDESNASESDFERASTLEADMKQKDLEIEKKYNAQFKTFLSAKQIYKLKEAEDAFRKKMMEMRHQRRRK